MEMTRCIHDMLQGTCAICAGLVTAENQTREYWATHSSGFRVSRPGKTDGLYDVTDDVCPRPRASVRQPTKEEIWETDAELKSATSDKICSICGRPKPRTEEFWNRNSNAADGFDTRCKACKALQWRSTQGKKEERVEEKKGTCKRCGEEKSLTVEFFYQAKTSSGFDTSRCKACRKILDRERKQARPKKWEPITPEAEKPVEAKDDLGARVLDELQGRLDRAVQEVRDLHVAMLTVRKAFGVQREIRFPRLVG